MRVARAEAELRKGHSPIDVFTVGTDTPGMLTQDVRERLNLMKSLPVRARKFARLPV
jgi:hypothetical protein